MNSIQNRLEKNLKHRQQMMKKYGYNSITNSLEAYRLYDRDIPEYPYIVDIYKDWVLIYEKGIDEKLVKEDVRERHFQELRMALIELKFLEKKIIIKKREKMSGPEQYKRINNKNHYFIVKEGPAHFLVNLHDFLDTGLFLDHRPLRQMIYKKAEGKKVLNLFSYTSTIGIMASLGQASRVVNVDLSKTYIDWSIENAKINHQGHLPKNISFVNEDVYKFLETAKVKNGGQTYDIIILDPPTFSNSKSMSKTFDVERDHAEIIKELLHHLATDTGELYFSTNKRNFKISPELSAMENLQILDITKKTIPFDYHDQKIHHCFLIKAQKAQKVPRS